MPRRLRWDGERWWVIDSRGEQEGAQVQVRLDAQRWMLLWFHDPAAARATWLWAQASHDPVRWHLLRCALYLPLTSASVGAPPSSEAGRA